MNLSTTLSVPPNAMPAKLPVMTGSLPFGRVQRIDPLEYPGWDDAVLALPGVTFFHSTAWAGVLRSSYGHHPNYFAVFERDRLVAALPVMEVHSWLTGRRGLTLPFTDACEPLGDRSLLKDAIVPQLKQHGRQRAWKYFECRGGRELFGEAPAFQSYFMHESPLCHDEAYLFSRLDSPTRRAIRKAEKSGVIVEFSQSLEHLRAYYSLHCRTRQKHGLPPQPFKFFARIHEHVLQPGKGAVALAKHSGRWVAGAVFFHSGHQAIYKFGASDAIFQELRANNLLMWEAMKRYAREGLKALNFGRTSLSNEGLRRFKLGWGAKESRADYVRYDLRSDRYCLGKDGAVGWHNQVFQRLPRFASRWLGELLYPHMG